MHRFRTEPPKEILNSKVVEIKDYKEGKSKNLDLDIETVINLPKSDVLQFLTEDGTKISVRPSGTEPKIKFYFGIKEKLSDISDYDIVNAELDNKLNKLAQLFSEL